MSTSRYSDSPAHVPTSSIGAHHTETPPSPSCVFRCVDINLSASRRLLFDYKWLLVLITCQWVSKMISCQVTKNVNLRDHHSPFVLQTIWIFLKYLKEKKYTEKNREMLTFLCTVEGTTTVRCVMLVTCCSRRIIVLLSVTKIHRCMNVKTPCSSLILSCWFICNKNGPNQVKLLHSPEKDYIYLMITFQIGKVSTSSERGIYYTILTSWRKKMKIYCHLKYMRSGGLKRINPVLFSEQARKNETHFWRKCVPHALLLNHWIHLLDTLWNRLVLAR